MNLSSQTISILFAKAERLSAVTSEDFQTLLRATMAPLHLQGFYFLLSKLMPTLECAREICRLSGHENFIHRIIDPSIRSIQNLLNISSEVESDPRLSHLFAQEDGNPRDVFQNILEKHLLYCTLGHSVLDKNLTGHYTHLLAQTFLTSHMVASHNPQDIHSLLNAYRGIRMLSLQKYSSQLTTLPAESRVPKDFLAAICAAKTGTRLNDASVLFKKAQRGLAQTQSPPPSKTDIVPRPDNYKDPGDEEFPPEPFWTGTESLNVPASQPEEDKAYRNLGGASKEFAFPRDDIPVIATQERVYDRATLRELAFQAKQVSNRIAMSNQFFPLSWEELNQFDIAILLKYISGKISTSEPILQERAVRRLILTLFWSGSPIERVLAMDFFWDGGTRRQAGNALYWNGGETPFFCLLSPGPELSEEARGKDYPQALPTSGAANIPLPEIVREFLAPLLPGKAIPHSFKGRPLFNQEPESLLELRGSLSACLRRLNREHGTRLTADRISQYLVRNLARMPRQDLPSAALFFGYNERLAVTRIHYTHAYLLSLENSYRDMCKDLLSPLGYVDTFSTRQVNFATAAVGTPWCPSEETVQKLVGRLIDTVEANRPDPGDIHRVSIFHNHYAVYTACFIAFATGYRAVLDPSFEDGTIDEETGLALISDKTDDLGYSIRMIWVPEECLAQIQYYRDHLLALYDRIGPASPPLFNLIKNHCGPGRPSRLFHIDLDLCKTQLLGPGLLKRLMERQFDYLLPPNANRHYLKNHLLKSGCPQEIIEAYLGHWELGQEPWHGLSGLRPSTFREILKKYLPSRLQADGWRPLKGFVL